MCAAAPYRGVSYETYVHTVGIVGRLTVLKRKGSV